LDCCIEEQLAGRAQPVIDLLRQSGLSLVTAESCTAGLVAAVLSHGAQASEWLHGGFVVYTKAQKSEALGVDDRLLASQGSVNSEVAREMAEGALRHSHATLGLSVTGVLGPNPDEDNNPPGLVYLGLARSGQPTTVVRCDFGKIDPDEVRRRTVIRALELVVATIAPATTSKEISG
jgi:nicotinamide-nucleotide amidase